MSEQIYMKLPTKRGYNRDVELISFSKALINIRNKVGFKISSRGWCYQLEGFRLVNKSQFDLVEKIINECREKGFLPIDFVAEEESRQFSGIEIPNTDEPLEYMERFLNAIMICDNWFTPDWWDGEEYYIQMLVEKIDVKTLFEPVCREYHIPIATSKGWSSMLQRAEYAKRFSEAEQNELKCVLLYCGDHDPDGLRISDFIRNNLYDLKDIRWNDGTKGYNPDELIIDRFGLNYDFIQKNNLTWIDNLITGSGKDLSSPTHQNHYMQYVQEYIHNIGIRKCEANALVVNPEQAEMLCRNIIERYLGEDALDRFNEKRQEIREKFKDIRKESGLDKSIPELLNKIRKGE